MTSKQRSADDTGIETLANLSARRGYVRQKITKLFTRVNESFSTWSRHEISMHLLKCKDLRTEITALDDEIFSICISNKMPENELSERSSFDENYTDKLLSIMSLLESPVEQNIEAANHTFDSSMPRMGETFSGNKLKLPQVELPFFGNKKGENLSKFLKTFEAIVEKHKLSSFEKFVHLQKQLSNAPKILVDSLDVDQHSFEIAKELLKEAFDSIDKSKDEIISALANLNLPSHEQPYNYIGQMRTIISAFKSLNVTVDDILRYFVWNGFNREFQSNVTNITNKCKPSLEEINACIFEATDRYLKQLNHSKYEKENTNKLSKSKNSTVMAINITDKSKVFYVLCVADKKQSDHQLRSCPVYDSPKNKFDKLRKIKACVKCSFANHEANNCKFKFKSNCRNCNGSHMTFLCMKSPAATSSNVAACPLSENDHVDQITNNVS